MRVIAIDPGYDRVGIAILEKDDQNNNKKEKILFSECFITQRENHHNKRIFNIGERVYFLIKKYNIDVLVIEALFFSKNTKTAMLVAEARGVIIFQAYRNNIPVFEYTPNQIKLAVTGYGNANKKDIFFMLPKLIYLDERKRIDDELDAIALGITFLSSYKKIII